MWLLWSVAALAADPTVALPPGEPSEPWHAPLRMAGLEVGESGEAARLRVEGSQWELCVSRAPEPTCVALEPPTTDRQREDVAWLVVSLQNELVFDAGGGAVVAATPRAVAKETSAVPPPAAEPAPSRHSRRRLAAPERTLQAKPPRRGRFGHARRLAVASPASA